MLRKVQKLGLQTLFNGDKTFRKGVKMLIQLALLRPQDVPSGFDFVKRYFKVNSFENVAAHLIQYFQEQWIEKVTPESFCVFGQPHRTNNFQESFHHIIMLVMGLSHPGVWQFLGNFQTFSPFISQLDSTD